MNITLTISLSTTRFSSIATKTVEKKIELDDEDAIGVDLKSLLQKVKADSEKEEPKETTDNTTKEADITETPPEKEYGADDDELEETI